MRVTREEEELLKGLRRPSERGGRLPTFYREEVDRIRQDTRPLVDIAEAWGVAIDTIRRVQQRGSFAAVPYIPRDEVDRSEKYPDYADAAIAYVQGQVRPGRPFASGRPALTDAELAEILVDKRPAKEIAHSYGLRTTYVQMLKRQLKYIEDVPVTLKVTIQGDQRDVDTLSRAYKVPKHIVEEIKRAD